MASLHKDACPECKGLGEHWESFAPDDGMFHDCETCGGSGVVRVAYDPTDPNTWTRAQLVAELEARKRRGLFLLADMLLPEDPND